MVNKNAYMRTLEAVIAIILTFAFILYIMPSNTFTIKEDTTNILIGLMNNEAFREDAQNLTACAYKSQNESINQILDVELKSYLNYAVCPQGILPELPRKRVNVESLYLTGNYTNTTNKVIKLYYWE